MDWIQALLLGLVQGLTEYLPVSSSGHLAIGSALFGIEGEENLAFTVIVHVATVFSTLVILWKEISWIFKGLAQCRMNDETRYFINIVISMIPVGIVGTRNATDYGKSLCQRFMQELSALIPDVLIVSGLAYGIDIHAHRDALTHGFDTVGVLAHGLDRIYPAVHRRTATEMLTQGGLLTEFMSGTNPDRQNFVKRNRIVAGISDATLVVESGPKGGSLITAEIAESYQRDCFAFPGRVGDTYSTGCNLLIQKNRAALIQSAEDMVKAMNWDHVPISPQVVQRQLFPELTPEEEQVITHLQKHPDGIQINTLVVESNIAINRMTSLLFNLEMKGVVRALAGGVYKMA